MPEPPLPEPSTPPVRGFVFDMDGTLAVGEPSGRGFVLLPGVAAFFAHLRKAGLPIVVFTNGTANPPERYAENLRAAGLDIGSGEMMTPSSVAADLFGSLGVKRVLILGVEGVSQPLEQAQVRFARPGEPGAEAVDAVYIGWHPEFRLSDIAAATDAILAGADFYVSSDVPFFYSSRGRTLGVSGLIAAAVTSTTGKAPHVVGKPSAIAATTAAKRLGCAITEIAIVGDDPRLETAMARQSGAIGIGVTTGLTGRADWAALPPSRRAHFVVDRVDEIVALNLLPGS
jgi:NagD protein